MIGFQNHAGVLIKDRTDIGLIVFAAKAEEHAIRHLAEHELLQCTMCGRDLHFFRAVLATNPAPKGVVTIQHNHFLRCATQPRKRAEHATPDGRKTFGGVRHMAQMTGVGIVEFVSSITRKNRLWQDYPHIGEGPYFSNKLFSIS